MNKKAKEVSNISEQILMDDEKVLHEREDLIVTNKRVIKYGTGFFQRIKQFFAEEYQDILLKDIVSIKIDEHINALYFKIGSVISLSIFPLSFFTDYEPFSKYITINLYIGIISISMIFFVLSYLDKYKILSIIGKGAKINFSNYTHEELLLIREIQDKNRHSKK